jgi:hypothetical protein
VITATIVALMMEALSTSETSVSFYETTQRGMPQDNELHATDYLLRVYFVTAV